VRRVAAQRLARAPQDGETALALTRAVRTDPDTGVRRECLLALGGQGTLATHALLERLADADAEVRMVATSSLFRADPQSAATRFAHELPAAPSAERVEAARQALSSEQHASLHAAARDQLARALAHHDGALRAQVAVALTALPRDDARALALSRAPHEGLRSIQLWLALAIGGAEGKVALRVLARERDVVAAQARAELARMREPRSHQGLEELLGCAEVPVRLIAVRTLGGELRDPHAIRSALLDPQLEVRLAAASTILAAS
jgi:HEAT repeat protein